MSELLDPLVAGRDAAERQAWRDAYAHLSAADRAELTPADLEHLAEAAWWTGRLEEAIGLREQAFAGYTGTGERGRAAMVGLGLVSDQIGRGAFSIAQGWLAKTERLLAAEPESAAHGHLAFARASMGARTGRLDGVAEELERAYELAQRYGDDDLAAMALVIQGRVRVQTGDITGGLAMLDEATAAAVSGELQPFATGLVYCCTIASCQAVGDYARAAEWTAEANRWCDRADVTGFPGACRIHRAELLRLRGQWPEAEEQAEAACAELHEFDRWLTGSGFYEIGEIRRRRGDFAAAEEAYRRAGEWGREPQPGLALVRLAQGKVETAAKALRRALGELQDPLARAHVLPAYVQVALAAGDVPAARAAAEELDTIADTYRIGDARTPAFEATAHLAWGQIELAEGDTEPALRCLRRARDEWQRIGAPYEVAQARMLLGLAYRSDCDEDAARGELESALDAFERLGAKLDAERARDLLGRHEARRTFVFTDIVDSTKLLEALGDEKWKRVLDSHERILSAQITRAGGEIVKHTGDGVFAAFESAKAAVDGAVAIQRALGEEVFAPDVRIGIHTGSAFRSREGSDYGGQGVHAAARIGAAAGGGEILVSAESLDGAGVAHSLSAPRDVELKGLAEPVRVVSVTY